MHFGVVLAVMAAASITGCSSNRETVSSVVTCPDSKLTNQDVDYTGTPTGTNTPSDAIVQYTSRAGRGLPVDGYSEVAPSADPLHQDVTTSPADPGDGTSLAAAPKHFVHHTGNAIDVSLMVTSYRGSWRVESAAFCLGSKT